MSNVIMFPQKLKPQDGEYLRLRDQLIYYYTKVEEIHEAESENGNSLLGGMSNMFGNHSKEVRHLFLSFHNNPCSETWQAIRSHMVDSSTTSWQLWIKFDLNAPRCLDTPKKHAMFPSADDFVSYYKEHRKNTKSQLIEKVEELQKLIDQYDH